MKYFNYFCLNYFEEEIRRRNEFLVRKNFKNNDKIFKDISIICSGSLEKFILDFKKEISFSRYKINCGKINDHFLKFVPIPYIKKSCFFYNIPLFIRKGVFIPQGDTEILIEKAIFLSKEIWREKCSKLRVLEIGTGSGNISLALANFNRNWSILATDIDSNSLDVARYNSKKLGFFNIDFLLSDLFSKINDNYFFDIIISNPPYLSFDDYRYVCSFTKQQPKNSLVSKDGGYWFYKQIIFNAKKRLNKKFLVIFEIGEKQAKNIAEIILKNFDDCRVDVFKDFGGKDRVICFYKK